MRLRLRGMGDSAQSIIQGGGSPLAAGAAMAGRATGSSGHGSCSWAYWNLWPGAQLDPACSYAAMPTPGAGTGSPTISLSTTPSATSVYAGQDSAGNPIYATPSTPQENMADFKASIDAYMANVGDANPPPPPDDPCAHWYSFMNPNCNGTTGLVFATAAALGVVVLGVALSGGRR